MPSNKETVVNKALSGDELKKIILADFARLADNEGMLSSCVAFGKVGYSIVLSLHMDNPHVPDTKIELTSKPIAHNLINDDNRELEAIDTAPLPSPSPIAEVGALELTRKIDNPNAERLRNEIPIPVITRGHDGTTQTEQILYPPDHFPELGPGEVMLKDATEMTRAAWNIVEPSQGNDSSEEVDR